MLLVYKWSGWRFQSTPLPTGRSDASAARTSTSSECFNPRPSQPEGATQVAKFNRCRKMFQSTPLPTGRSDRYRLRPSRAPAVSIHAPPNRKERH